MRYARNILDGYGPIYNIGEQSYGFTSIAWLGLMSGVAALVPNTAVTWKMVGSLLVLLSIGILLIHFRRLPLPSALCLSVVPVLDPFSIRWLASGMENGLVLCISVMCFCAWHRLIVRPEMLSLTLLSAVAIVGPFVRPEFAILSLAVILFLVVARRRAWLIAAIAIIAAGGLIALLVHGWTGFFVPQTGRAKALLLAQSDPLYAPITLARIVFFSAACGLLAIFLTRRQVRTHRVLVAAAGALLAAILAYFLFTNTLISTRYSVSFSAPILSVAALCLAGALTATGQWTIGMRMAVGLQACLCLAGLLWMWPATTIDEVKQIRVIGEWARANLPTGQYVALTEIGAFGFYYQGSILDLVGLVSPRVVDYAAQHGRPRTLPEMEALLAEYNAGYYVETSGQELPLRGHVLAFTPMHRWVVTRNNLSGGREPKQDIWRIYKIDQKS